MADVFVSRLDRPSRLRGRSRAADPAAARQGTRTAAPESRPARKSSSALLASASG